MKKFFKYLILAVIVIFVVFYLIFSAAVRNLTKVLSENPVIPFDISLVEDGVYRDLFDAKIVSAEVEVEVESGRITDIRLLKHNHGKGYGAEAILPVVLKAQSLDVDVITGATGSCQVVLKAIELALRQGVNDQNAEE